MSELIEPIDPLDDPEKKKIIDTILEENKDLNGATMVVLNLIQERINQKERDKSLSIKTSEIRFKI